jgi:hypothetical protein
MMARPGPQPFFVRPVYVKAIIEDKDRELFGVICRRNGTTPSEIIRGFIRECIERQKKEESNGR